MGLVLGGYFLYWIGPDRVFGAGEGENGWDCCGKGVAEGGDDHSHGRAGGEKVVDEKEMGERGV